MRRAMRTPRAIAGFAIATLAVVSAITVQTAVQGLGLNGGAVALGATAPTAKKSAGPARALAALPLAFVPNRGQTDPRVRFYAAGNHFALFATPDELMLSLTKEKPARQLALALRFLGRSAHVTTTGAGRTPGRISYLHGTDPARWQRNLAAYRGVVYRELWPHIDLRLHQERGALK